VCLDNNERTRGEREAAGPPGILEGEQGDAGVPSLLRELDLGCIGGGRGGRPTCMINCVCACACVCVCVFIGATEWPCKNCRAKT
jgi:hypothetical protein